MRYSQDPTTFRTTLIASTFDAEFAIYLDTAITSGKPINFADEYPRFQITDAEFTAPILKLIGKTETKTLNFATHNMNQSHSVPYEYYFSLKEDPSNYFVIIFEP